MEAQVELEGQLGLTQVVMVRMVAIPLLGLGLGRAVGRRDWLPEQAGLVVVEWGLVPPMQ